MAFFNFISIDFLLFLFFVTATYYIIPMQFRWIVLLIASTAFYISAGIEKLPFIAFTSLVVFLAAGRMDRVYELAEQEADAGGLAGKARMQHLMQTKKRCRDRYVIPTIILVMLQLCYCKFGSYLLQLVRENMYSWTAADILVPLGISYYTFSSLGYLLDIYWRKNSL